MSLLWLLLSASAYAAVGSVFSLTALLLMEERDTKMPKLENKHASKNRAYTLGWTPYLFITLDKTLLIHLASGSTQTVWLFFLVILRNLKGKAIYFIQKKQYLYKNS